MKSQAIQRVLTTDPSALTVMARMNTVPYTFRSGLDSHLPGACCDTATLQDMYASELQAFETRFNGGQPIEPLTLGLRWSGFKWWRLDDAGKRLRIEAAKRKTADFLRTGNLKAAASAAYKFGDRLWDYGLYTQAPYALVFGAALKLGWGRRAAFDLSDEGVRAPLFQELEKAGLITYIDTSTFPRELKLGTRWAQFRRILGGYEFDTYSRLVAGAGLVEKIFATERQDMIELPSGSIGFRPYMVPPNEIRKRMLRETEEMDRIRGKGIPVVDVHHVYPEDAPVIASVRTFVEGVVAGSMGHPLNGFNTDERLQADESWSRRAIRLREAGFWTGLSVEEMQKCAAYSYKDREWVVFDTPHKN